MKIINKLFITVISIIFISFLSLVAFVFLTIFMPENVKEALEIFKSLLMYNK